MKPETVKIKIQFLCFFSLPSPDSVCFSAFFPAARKGMPPLSFWGCFLPAAAAHLRKLQRCGSVPSTFPIPAPPGQIPISKPPGGIRPVFSQFLLRESMLFSQCCNLRRQFQNILPFLFLLTLPNTVPFDHQPALSFCQPMVAYNCFKLFLASSIAERTYHYD